MRTCVICQGPIPVRRSSRVRTCSTQCSTDLDATYQNRAAGYRVTDIHRWYASAHMPHQRTGYVYR